jgi:hypothetical protein
VRPRILAGFVQGTLAALEPEVRARVRSRLAPETLAKLESSSRLAWLPIEIDVELTHAVYAELGPARAHELFRRNLSGALDTPILRSLAHGALRLFGASPERLFGWAPKAYTQLYRDSGTMRFAPEGPGSGRLALSQLPPAIAESRDYLDGVAAALAAGFDLMGVKGEVTIERIDVRARCASFRLLWELEPEPLDPIPQPAQA